jgi:hypothetical protein
MNQTDQEKAGCHTPPESSLVAGQRVGEGPIHVDHKLGEVVGPKVEVAVVVAAAGALAQADVRECDVAGSLCGCGRSGWEV